MMKGNQQQIRIIALFALPVVLIAVYYLTNPFAEILSQKKIALSTLSAPQRANIQLAARTLDGLVLRPQEQFSFNVLVGPRSMTRGYLKAPSYIEANSPKTEGGGICLLSSAIYQLALESKMVISQRWPHTRTIKTVAPGLDATVWYGGADLRFHNNRPYPVRLLCRSTTDQLSVELVGPCGAGNEHKAILHRLVNYPSDSLVNVSVIRQEGAHGTLISRDLYRRSR